jgi:hypothetical protein
MTQIGSNQVGALQVGAAQVCSTQISAIQNRLAQVDSPQVPTPAALIDACPDQVPFVIELGGLVEAKVCPLQVDLPEIGSQQIGSGPIGLM